MEIWSSPAAYDERNGSAERGGGTDPIARELEEVLCAERVARITKTYHDIDAVTNLLDEERDLELAARIGQSLLKQNRSLTERNELLEEQLELAKEEIAQLRHEVSMRDDLLHFYTTTTEESEPISCSSAPLQRPEPSLSLQQYFQYETLQQKLKCLEEENQKLRMEANNITTETCRYEEQEQQLMIDCVEQFSEASQQVAQLSEELARRAEDTARQQEEISQLLVQVVDLQRKCRAYGAEVEELQQHLAAAKEGAAAAPDGAAGLAGEVHGVRGMLQEAQEEVKSLRSRSLPNSTVSRYSTASLLPVDSLAAEIKGMMRKGADSSSSDYKSCRRIFETVKAVNQAAKAKSCSESPRTHRAPSRALLPLPWGAAPPAPARRVPGARGPERSRGQRRAGRTWRPRCCGSRCSGRAARTSAPPWRRSGSASSGCGTGTAPAASSAPTTASAPPAPTGSASSELTAGSGFSLGSLSYLPDKLQIVKPLEGSVTLHHWQQLARAQPGRDPGAPSRGAHQRLPALGHRPGARLQPRRPGGGRRGRRLLPAAPYLNPRQSQGAPRGLYNAVVPSCGPFEGLNRGSPCPELSSGYPSTTSTPVGLVRLLLGRGILPSVPGLPRAHPRPFPTAGGQEGPRPRSSIFSLNLVEKLQRLGLDTVVARGEMSCTRGQHRGGRGALT
ncbi:huntingtin-associated protein 1 isoform X2 [Pezoporus flaviventris]|uniref:huntingtin-associated protein 1 isoform X2 n=1 Tax=Pezoporus flaviventris TaxID=889875 RepID=UPI002AB05153|nr:huntingtin-associated protein 1 isoform X2 [Pezoporus flaviventris]